MKISTPIFRNANPAGGQIQGYEPGELTDPKAVVAVTSAKTELGKVTDVPNNGKATPPDHLCYLHLRGGDKILVQGTVAELTQAVDQARGAAAATSTAQPAGAN